MSFSPEKIFLVGLIAMMVLGPSRLPQAARTAGKLLAEFRRLSASVQSEVAGVTAEPRDSLRQAVGDLGIDDVRATLTDARSTLHRTVSEVLDGSSAPAPGGPCPDDPSLN
jgi:sec-independent protein translocase protein TatB